MRKPPNGAIASGEAKPEPTNLTSVASALERVRRGKQSREDFVASHVDKAIAFQIRAMRERYEMNQTELGELVGMNQNAISRLESQKRGRPTITTLKRLAAAFDVALVVRFVPYSQLVSWVSGMPFVDHGLTPAALAVPNFAAEENNGAFGWLLGRAKALGDSAVIGGKPKAEVLNIRPHTRMAVSSGFQEPIVAGGKK